MRDCISEKIIDEVFIPSTHKSCSEFILGPCVEPESPSEHASLYPIHHGEDLLLHSVLPEWFNNHRPFRLWPVVNVSWVNWVNRVEKEKGELWKSIGIYDAIQFSKIDIPKDKNLLYGALCFWSTSHNAFHFRFGMMGPTVLDIVALTGFWPHGDEVSSLGIVPDEITNVFPMNDEGEEILSYGKFVEVSMGKTSSVSEREHISFLIMWLSKFVFCDTSERITKKYTRLAFALATGKKLALAPLVLGHLYHTCKGIVVNKFGRAGGPIWILHLWLQSYFPELKPEGNSATAHSKNTHRLASARGQISPKSFTEYFRFFYGCSARTAAQFTPLCNTTAPKWFHQSLYPNSAKGGNKQELVDIWASFFIARALQLCLSSCQISNCKCGVEYYSPNQCARQLGMTQGVPLPPVQSAYHPATRALFLSVKSVEEASKRFETLKKKFSFLEGSKSTDSFESWWSIYVAKTWTKSADVTVDKMFKHSSPRYTCQDAVKLQQKPSGCVDTAIDTYIKKERSYEGPFISPLNLLSKKEGFDKEEEGSSHETSSSQKSDGDTLVSDETPSSNSSLPCDKDVKIETVEEVAAGDPSSDITDFFTKVATQLKRAQTDFELPSPKKSRHSAEALAKSKSNVQKFLGLPFQDVVLPCNRSALGASLPVYAASPSLPVAKARSLKQLESDLPLLCSDFCQAKRDLEEYEGKVAEKATLVDELSKAEESHIYLKNKLDKLNTQIQELKESLKVAEANKEAIEKQQLKLKESCFPKLAALDEVNAGFSALEEKKELAKSAIARVETSWAEFKLKIIYL